MCGLLEHMPTNGRAEKSDLTISYKATFTYNISKENTQLFNPRRHKVKKKLHEGIRGGGGSIGPLTITSSSVMV